MTRTVFSYHHIVLRSKLRDKRLSVLWVHITSDRLSLGAIHSISFAFSFSMCVRMHACMRALCSCFFLWFFHKMHRMLHSVFKSYGIHVIIKTHNAHKCQNRAVFPCNKTNAHSNTQTNIDRRTHCALKWAIKQSDPCNHIINKIRKIFAQCSCMLKIENKLRDYDVTWTCVFYVLCHWPASLHRHLMLLNYYWRAEEDFKKKYI